MRILIDFSDYNLDKKSWEYKYQIIDENFNQIKQNDSMFEYMCEMDYNYQEIMKELNLDIIITPDKIYKSNK